MLDEYASSLSYRLKWAYLLGIVLVLMVPVFFNFYVSFNEYGFAAANYKFTLDWYFVVFDDSQLKAAFGWTLFLAAITVIGSDIISILLEIGIISDPITVILFSPLGVIIGDVLSFMPFMVFAGFLAMEAVPKYVFEVCQDLGAGKWRTMIDIIIPLAAPGIFAGSVFILVNALGVALVPSILGGPGAVNAGLIATQAIAALDFPLAMAISAIMMATLFGLLYVGHRLFNLTRILEPAA